MQNPFTNQLQFKSEKKSQKRNEVLSQTLQIVFKNSTVFNVDRFSNSLIVIYSGELLQGSRTDKINGCI